MTTGQDRSASGILLAMAAAGLVIALGCSTTKEAAHSSQPWRAPGESRADSALQVNVLQGVYKLDDLRTAKCVRRRISATEVVQGRNDPSHWVERWTVDRCGDRATYLVEFEPRDGGTGFTVRPDFRAPGHPSP